MATYPAFVHLLRLLGRDMALSALGVEAEPDPETLSAEQRAALRLLVDAELERVADELVEEAAASDDVLDRAGAEAFIRERVAAFGDLLTTEQAARLLALSRAAVEDWS